MLQLYYDEDRSLVMATSMDEIYDATIAKEQMHQIIGLPNLGEEIRILRIFKNVIFRLAPYEVKEHFTYVQQKLNESHFKKCLLAIVTDVPINTALGFLYQASETFGGCDYIVKVFSTEAAAIDWLINH